MMIMTCHHYLSEQQPRQIINISIARPDKKHKILYFLNLCCSSLLKLIELIDYMIIIM